MKLSAESDDSLEARRIRFIRIARMALSLWLVIAAGGALRVAWAVHNHEVWTDAGNLPMSSADLHTGLLIFFLMAILAATLLVLLQKCVKRLRS